MPAYPNRFTNLERLRGVFQESSLRALSAIFSAAASPNLTAGAKQKLNRALHAVLAQEEADSMISFWRTSPSGETHLFVKDSFYLLFRVDGFLFLCENALFFEGDSAVRNVQWIEEDHLLLFDDYCIFRQTAQKYVCHYAFRSHPFVSASAVRRVIPRRNIQQGAEH